MQSKPGKGAGFSLIELMIVIVIVAVLAGVALPAYQEQVLKTKRGRGKAELLEVMARQEQYFVNNKIYAGSLIDLGYPGTAAAYAIDIDGNDDAVTAVDRIYLIQLSTTPPTFTLQAAPQLGQVKDTRCGTLQVTSTGAKSATGSGGADECW
jgi:type IV pilus assembly protein PilE